MEHGGGGGEGGQRWNQEIAGGPPRARARQGGFDRSPSVRRSKDGPCSAPYIEDAGRGFPRHALSEFLEEGEFRVFAIELPEELEACGHAPRRRRARKEIDELERIRGGKGDGREDNTLGHRRRPRRTTWSQVPRIRIQTRRGDVTPDTTSPASAARRRKQGQSTQRDFAGGADAR